MKYIITSIMNNLYKIIVKRLYALYLLVVVVVTVPWLFDPETKA